jgi:putative flippase GtrA
MRAKVLRAAANAEFVKFLMVGVANTVLGYVLFALLTPFMHYEFAYSISYAIGVVFAYFANSLFVFREALTWRKFMAFPLVYVVQWLIGALLLPLLIEVLHFNPLLAQPAVILITLPITYVLSRAIVRSKPEAQENAH